MKLLYISCSHTTQEFDDLTLFTELGIDWFSTGIYANPKAPLLYYGSLLRNSIEKEPNKVLLDQFNKINPNRGYHKYINLNKKFISNFDVIMCSYSTICINNLERVLAIVDNKIPIIFRTYGFQSSKFELYLKGAQEKFNLYLIRNSPQEQTIKDYAGHSSIIRGYVDETIYKDWSGEIPQVLTFANDFNARLRHCNYNCYRIYMKEIFPHIPAALQGYGNENVTKKKAISWDEQVALYKKYAVYFNLNSPPASLTYSFVEALMTGIPIVSIGPKLGSIDNVDTYEVPKILINGENGFYSDSVEWLRGYINMLLNDRELGKKIGAAGRKTALSLFSKQIIKEQWEIFFKSIV